MKMRQLLVQILILLIAQIQPGYSQASTSNTVKPIDFNKYHSTLFGDNVFIFEPGMDMKEIQVVIDTIFTRQSGKKGEFSKNRYAIFFKPGIYNLDVKIDYYIQVLGLGLSP
jgi:hypothetical protein